jgi:hypothetical protein
LESLSGTVAEEKISTINNKDLNAFESSITWDRNFKRNIILRFYNEFNVQE